MFRMAGFVSAVVVVAGVSAATAAPVDFQRDVQPLLSEHCALCHGLDAANRKSGLRLDVRDSALKGGDSGTAAISPGKPEESELIRRITATDPQEVMPPPRHNKPLSPKQIETLRQWIKDGAKYESHWAFTAPRKVKLPDGAQAEGGAPKPVDALVASRLKERGLALSPPASPAALCRRLYLDLVGLPPSPQELAAFEQQGFEATVEKLLASERFGEK